MADTIPYSEYLDRAFRFPDLETFFQTMNDVEIRYLVLRNWDSLPDSVELGPHSDLDLLIDDRDLPRFHAAIRPVTTNRDLHITQRLSRIGESYIKIDVRSVHDQYLPAELAQELLEHRRRLACFYVPRRRELFMSLLYHAIFQKPTLGEDYRQRLRELALLNFDTEQLSRDIDELRLYCYDYFTMLGYGVVEPFDEWVYWYQREKNHPPTDGKKL